jgi:hypothetical protein
MDGLTDCPPALSSVASTHFSLADICFKVCLQEAMHFCLTNAKPFFFMLNGVVIAFAKNIFL